MDVALSATLGWIPSVAATGDARIIARLDGLESGE